MSDAPFIVVGIGASAGGLQALQQFFAAMPAASEMAFVIVTHLAPEQESYLSQLIQPHTTMPVRQVDEALAIERNHVYVIPPNRNISTIDSHLRLSPIEEARRNRAPIDHFLRTLAGTHGAYAIGIILSGTGSDGTIGPQRIKEAGGLAVVQEPTEAAYDGMAHDLGMEAVAEGIETVEQLIQLKYLNCNYGQGYLISRPVDPVGIENLLTKPRPTKIPRARQKSPSQYL